MTRTPEQPLNGPEPRPPSPAAGSAPSQAPGAFDASADGVASKPGAAPHGPAPASLLGQWQGQGWQDDGATWSMQVHVKSLSGERCADVYYPALECGGVWHCDAKSNGAVLVGREAIAFGLETCIASGQLELRLTSDGDHAEWSYTSSEHATEPENSVKAHAQLQRRQTSEPEPSAPASKPGAPSP